MRRAYKGKSDGLVRSSEGEQGFWPSYADMMSALALILFFLMLLSYIQNLITGNDLRNTQDVLDETRSALNATRIDLETTEETLSMTLSKVEKAESDLAKITIDLDETRLALSDAEEEKAGLDALLGEQRALIAEQETRIEEQEQYLSAASEELYKLHGQMQTIAVLRLSILEKIRDSFVAITGDASKVSIGDNGNIILSESILFDVGSSEIKGDAKPALDSLAEMFKAFLDSDENAKYVDSIVIAGHTDSTGSEEKNRTLSTDRANSVLGYLLSADSGKLNDYGKYFCAAGYGETRPVADNSTAAGRTENRRIEISVILKDDSIMEIVENYLDIELPQNNAE